MWFEPKQRVGRSCVCRASLRLLTRAVRIRSARGLDDGRNVVDLRRKTRFNRRNHPAPLTVRPKKNGTPVEHHRQTNSDSTKDNNWSTKGNVNPDTGKLGTKPGDK